MEDAGKILAGMMQHIVSKCKRINQNDHFSPCISVSLCVESFRSTRAGNLIFVRNPTITKPIVA